MKRVFQILVVLLAVGALVQVVTLANEKTNENLGGLTIRGRGPGI